MSSSPSKRLKSNTDPILELLPSKGWLHDYVTFTSGLEACTRFQFFSACSVLGAAVNNRVYIHRGDRELLAQLFPNPWVMLLAPPGRGHKTSTINMAVNCLQQACPETRIIADKITPESLVKALSEPSEKELIRIGPRDATGLIRAPEISVFFGRKTYNEGLITLITDLYDYRPEWVSETIMRGKNVLRNNCISIIGGSTPVWLQSKLPEDAFTGGFMSRFIIVEMPPTYYKRIAEPIRPSTSSWEKLVNGLMNFRFVEGEIGWSDKGRRYYKDYYENLKPTGNEQLDAYQEREVEQILKMSMLFALCEERMEVNENDLNISKLILRSLMKETEPRIERLNTHPRMKLVQDIQDLLRCHASLTRRELLGKVYRSLQYGEQQFLEAIRILGSAGVISIDGRPDNPTYSMVKDCSLEELNYDPLEGGSQSILKESKHRLPRIKS